MLAQILNGGSLRQGKVLEYFKFLLVFITKISIASNNTFSASIAYTACYMVRLERVIREKIDST